MANRPRTVVGLADDIPGAEGPVFDLDGRFFMVCPDRGQVLEILDEGASGRRVVCQTDGIPAGLQVDRDNNIWIADMKRGILKTTRDGQLVGVVETFDGRPIRGCNDCYFDSGGNLYFTAPAGSNRGKPEGELYCRLADGAVNRLDGGFEFCNGLAVTADDRTLIVAETFRNCLWAYDIPRPGHVGPKRLFANLPDHGPYGPDGMDFDVAGNLLVAHYGGWSVDVFDPAGGLIERVDIPFEGVTNVHFGGPGGRWVYVTYGSKPGGLCKFEWDRPGQRQYSDS